MEAFCLVFASQWCQPQCLSWTRLDCCSLVMSHAAHHQFQCGLLLCFHSPSQLLRLMYIYSLFYLQLQLYSAVYFYTESQNVTFYCICVRAKVIFLMFLVTSCACLIVSLTTLACIVLDVPFSASLYLPNTVVPWLKSLIRSVTATGDRQVHIKVLHLYCFAKTTTSISWSCFLMIYFFSSMQMMHYFFSALSFALTFFGHMVGKRKFCKITASTNTSTTLRFHCELTT